MLQDFVANDFARWPAPCKAYPDGLPVVELPRSWPPVVAPAGAVLAGRHAAAPAAGSAGARFPYELYVSARGVDGLRDGVHWYDPVGHALLDVGPAAGGEATTLVVTGVPWRTGWRHAERGFRHIDWAACSWRPTPSGSAPRG